MGKLYNLARMTTATTGTGTITLGSAVSGCLTFALAGVANSDVVSYSIEDGANSEVGTGTYTSSGTTLTRTVTKSTNSNAAISLSGTAEVFITPRAEDFPFLTAPLINSLGSAVALNNSSLYFDGPSVAQGTVGTWFVSGTVTLDDSTGTTVTYIAKLWDGTTLIASARSIGGMGGAGAPGVETISLSGIITNPAGNLRISVNAGSTTAAIQFNISGLGKDSTITAVRIA